MAGPERLLLEWIWSVRGSEEPSVSHQSSWVDGETINLARKDQGRKRERDLPEAEMGSKEAIELHLPPEGQSVREQAASTTASGVLCAQKQAGRHKSWTP